VVIRPFQHARVSGGLFEFWQDLGDGCDSPKTGRRHKVKVVVLTHSCDRHYFFCNRVIEKTNVVGVITGGKPVNRSFPETVRRKLRRSEILYTLRNKALSLAFREYIKMLAGEKAAAEESQFGGSQKEFEDKYSHLLLAHVDKSHRSINDQYYVDLIQEAKPEIIVVMGTCMIGRKIISSAPHVLNIHTGLSPYYRGGNTNLWPIIENDYGFFGVTIHEMSLGIDSGDIIYTAQPEVYPNDTFGRINCRCIKIGTNLMVRAIQQIEKGSCMTVKQWTKGKLFLGKHMNGYVAYKYFKKKAGFFHTHCKLAEEGKLPDLRVIRHD
jgi:folate-dependent phosphoribosylglycinamide formyltransferase PurN